MGFSKKHTKRSAMRSYRKRRPIRRRTTTKLVNTALKPIAQRFVTKMKYCETFTPGNASGQAPWRLNLNSIHDPNRTGIGHQPYSHDTFATLYNRYRVISCSYVVSAYSSLGATLQMAALPANEEFAAVSISDYRENPRCKFLVQTPGAPLKVLKGKVYLPSLVGRSKGQYMSDDRYQAQFGSSPQELAILNLNTQQFDETQLLNTGTTYQITLYYTVELFDLKNLGQS